MLTANGAILTAESRHASCATERSPPPTRPYRQHGQGPPPLPLQTAPTRRRTPLRQHPRRAKRQPRGGVDECSRSRWSQPGTAGVGPPPSPQDETGNGGTNHETTEGG